MGEEGRRRRAGTEGKEGSECVGGDVWRTGKLPVTAPVTRTWQTMGPSGKIQAEGEELPSTQREGSPGVSPKPGSSRSKEEELWGKLRKQREGQQRAANLTSASGTTSCLQNLSVPWVTLPLSLPFQNLPTPHHPPPHHPLPRLLTQPLAHPSGLPSSLYLLGYHTPALLPTHIHPSTHIPGCLLSPRSITHRA